MGRKPKNMHSYVPQPTWNVIYRFRSVNFRAKPKSGNITKPVSVWNNSIDKTMCFKSLHLTLLEEYSRRPLIIYSGR